MRTRRPNLAQLRNIPIPQPLRSCLDWIAVRCRIECCGIDALKPTPVHIKIWAESAGRAKTASALNQARSLLALLTDVTEPLSCKFLNYQERNQSDRDRFQQFVRELIAALEAITSPERQSS